MPLQSACTNLVRYMEDNRDNFRGKPRTESWTKFLLGDLYARHMIDQIVLAAKDYVANGELIKTFTQPVTARDTEHGKVLTEDHDFTVEPVDPTRRNARGVGNVVLRVHLHRKYTATLYLQF